MFSNRAWILKAGLALWAFVWMCERGYRQAGEVYPKFEQVIYSGETMSPGCRLVFTGSEVVTSGPEEFTIKTMSGPCTVISAFQPPVGSRVSGLVAVRDRARVQALEVRMSPGYEWKRIGTYAVSIAALLAVLWLARRRFTLRPSEGIFKCRTGEASHG